MSYKLAVDIAAVGFDMLVAAAFDIFVVDLDMFVVDSDMLVLRFESIVVVVVLLLLVDPVAVLPPFVLACIVDVHIATVDDGDAHNSTFAADRPDCCYCC